MPYQHFFRHLGHSLAVARYAFDSDMANLLETNTNLA